MTKVISETRMLATDENFIPPPTKKVCLSSSKRSHANQTFLTSNTLSGQMANSLDTGAVLNGFVSDSLHHPHHYGRNSSSPDESSNSDNATAPVATLSNLGNTCFLNSVLYTLRFAPSFLHNLHHLVNDLAEISGRHPSMKVKSSSLGRSIGNTSKSWSNKDFNSTDAKIAAATERLHDLYESLHHSELKDQTDPFQPEIFLQSLRDVNPIFEGNQQHDAHELLVCLIDNIRETCRQLTKHHETQQALADQKNNSIAMNSLPIEAQLPPSNKPSFKLKDKLSTSQIKKSLMFRRNRSNLNNKKNKLNCNSYNNILTEKQNLPSNDESKPEPLMNGDVPNSNSNFESSTEKTDCSSATCSPVSNSCLNFIAEDFQGVSVQCTVCLECEQVTQRQETFCDICVPIIKQDQSKTVNQLYHNSIVMDEFLVDSNKYWCEQCCRHNEAKRYVEYETLPRLLTLQLKRFSSGFNSGVEKVNEYMPTPFMLSCFCKDCSNTDCEEKKLHCYKLYGVIMHLGATIASGHYVAYVRACDNISDYENCSRDKKKTSSLSGNNLSISTPSSLFTTTQDKQTRLLKFFKSNKQSQNQSNKQSQNHSNFNLNDSMKNHLSSSRFNNCRSLDCCGIRFRNDSLIPANIDNCFSSDSWLECDDDTVRTLSEKDFREILEMKSSKNSASTPYLLFYVRIPSSSVTG